MEEGYALLVLRRTVAKELTCVVSAQLSTIGTHGRRRWARYLALRQHTSVHRASLEVPLQLSYVRLTMHSPPPFPLFTLGTQVGRRLKGIYPQLLFDFGLPQATKGNYIRVCMKFWICMKCSSFIKRIMPSFRTQDTISNHSPLIRGPR